MLKIPILCLSVLPLFASAQSLTERVTKNGGVPSELELRRDIAECRDKAFQEYPVTIVQTPVAPPSGQSTTNCFSSGGVTTCSTTPDGGVWGIPPSWVPGIDGRAQGQAYDANRESRKRAALSCMQLRGYAGR